MHIPVEKQIENAIMWIEALYSGEYKQAEGVLGDSERGFCCLGLGCHLTKVSYDPRWSYPEGDGLESNMGLLSRRGDVSGSTLSTPDAQWEGMFGEGSSYVFSYSLPQINDRTDVGFEGIAKWISTYPEFYFIPEVAKAIKGKYSD